MNNELYHHGVRGQKWGVRRYQNSDGSLKRSGKKLFKKVSENEDLKNKHTKEVRKTLKTLSKDKKDEAAYWKNEHKETKDLDPNYSKAAINASKKSIEQSKAYDKLVSDIDHGKLVAGRDFVSLINKKTMYGDDFAVFKRSDYEIKDNRTYNKTGIKVSRDSQNRVVGLSAKNASNRQIRKMNRMQRSINSKGDY